MESIKQEIGSDESVLCPWCGDIPMRDLSREHHGEPTFYCGICELYLGVDGWGHPIYYVLKKKVVYPLDRESDLNGGGKKESAEI